MMTTATTAVVPVVTTPRQQVITPVSLVVDYDDAAAAELLQTCCSCYSSLFALLYFVVFWGNLSGQASPFCFAARKIPINEMDPASQRFRGILRVNWRRTDEKNLCRLDGKSEYSMYSRKNLEKEKQQNGTFRVHPSTVIEEKAYGMYSVKTIFTNKI